MRNNLIFIILASLILNSCSQREFKGYYLGLEPMCHKNENGEIECYDPPNKWYHLNHLYFDQDSVFLYQMPIMIENRDTLYSASDGGFYYYAGKIINECKEMIVVLTLTNCDYCASPIIIDTLTNTYTYAPVIKRFQIYAEKDNPLINSVQYKKMADKEFPLDTKSFFFKIQENRPKKLN